MTTRVHPAHRTRAPIARTVMLSILLVATLGGVAASSAAGPVGRLYPHVKDCAGEAQKNFLSRNVTDGDTAPCRDTAETLYEAYWALDGVTNAAGITDHEYVERFGRKHEITNLASLDWKASGGNATVKVACRSHVAGGQQARAGVMTIFARLFVNGKTMGTKSVEVTLTPGAGDTVATFAIPTDAIKGKYLSTVRLDTATRGLHVAWCDLVPGATYLQIPSTYVKN